MCAWGSSNVARWILVIWDLSLPFRGGQLSVRCWELHALNSCDCHNSLQVKCTPKLKQLMTGRTDCELQMNRLSLRNNRFTIKASGNLLTHLELGNLQNIHQSSKEKLKDVNMHLVNHGNTRVSTEKPAWTRNQRCEACSHLSKCWTLMSGTEDNPKPPSTCVGFEHKLLELCIIIIYQEVPRLIAKHQLMRWHYESYWSSQTAFLTCLLLIGYEEAQYHVESITLHSQWPLSPKTDTVRLPTCYISLKHLVSIMSTHVVWSRLGTNYNV